MIRKRKISTCVQNLKLKLYRHRTLTSLIEPISLLMLETTLLSVQTAPIRTGNGCFAAFRSVALTFTRTAANTFTLAPAILITLSGTFAIAFVISAFAAIPAFPLAVFFQISNLLTDIV